MLAAPHTLSQMVESRARRANPNPPPTGAVAELGAGSLLTGTCGSTAVGGSAARRTAP